MRRELIIAAAVLVPFAVLVALGFAFSPDPAPLGIVEQHQPPPEAKGQGDAPAAVVFAVDASVQSPLSPPELEAPLRAVLPEVQRCFADQHLARAREVKVHFTPTPDGGFSEVKIDDTQDPYFSACLEDVFAEVRFHPDGRQTWQPATHTFSFGGPQD